MDPEPLGLVPLGRKTGGDPPPGEIRSRSSHASNMYITRSTVSRAEASRSTVDPTIHLGASTATDLFVGPATDARQPPRLTTVSPHPTTDGCAESPSTGNMKGRGSKPSAQLKKGHYHTQAGCIGLDDDDDDTPLVISTQARRCYLYVDIPSVPPPSLKRKASASKPTTVRKRKIMAEGNSQRKQPRVSITPRMKRRPPLPPTGGDDEEDFQSQDYAGGFTHMYNSNDRHVGTPEPVDATPASLPLPRANVPRTGPPLRAIRRISRTRIPKKSRTAVPAPTLLRPASADAPIPELCDSTRPLAKEIQGRDADTLAMTDGSGTRRCDNEHDGRPAAAANEAGRTVIDLVDADSEPPSPPVSAPLEGTRNEPLPAMSSALAVPATPKEDHHQFLNNPRPDPVVPHSHGPDVFMREAVAASLNSRVETAHVDDTMAGMQAPQSMQREVEAMRGDIATLKSIIESIQPQMLSFMAMILQQCMPALWTGATEQEVPSIWNMDPASSQGFQSRLQQENERLRISLSHARSQNNNHYQENTTHFERRMLPPMGPGPSFQDRALPRGPRFHEAHREPYTRRGDNQHHPQQTHWRAPRPQSQPYRSRPQPPFRGRGPMGPPSRPAALRVTDEPRPYRPERSQERRAAPPGPSTERRRGSRTPSPVSGPPHSVVAEPMTPPRSDTSNSPGPSAAPPVPSPRRRPSTDTQHWEDTYVEEE